MKNRSLVNWSHGSSRISIEPELTSRLVRRVSKQRDLASFATESKYFSSEASIEHHVDGKRETRKFELKSEDKKRFKITYRRNSCPRK